MKIVIFVVVVGLGWILGSGQASAQYPSFGGYGYGHGVHHTHHGHHYQVPAQPSVPGCGPALPNYGYGSPYLSGYANAIPLPPFATPNVSSYYSNNYYVRPTHSHHGWHPGHYLLGHH